jgi:hypothetical protein
VKNILRNARKIIRRIATLLLLLVGIHSDSLARSKKPNTKSIADRISAVQKAAQKTQDRPASLFDIGQQWGNWGNWLNWNQWIKWNQWNNWNNWNNWGNWGKG